MTENKIRIPAKVFEKLTEEQLRKIIFREKVRQQFNLDYQKEWLYS